MKTVLIDKELFDAIVFYHLFASEKERSNKALIRKIENSIEEKLKRVHYRNLYTASKTLKDPDLREIARQEYLDQRGILKDFRW